MEKATAKSQAVAGEEGADGADREHGQPYGDNVC